MTKDCCIKITHSYRSGGSGGVPDLRVIMKMFRCGFKALGGMNVESVTDHSRETDHDEIEYRLADGSSVVLKSSGAGSELTVCMTIFGDSREDAEETGKRILADIENIVYMDLRAGYCCE